MTNEQRRDVQNMAKGYAAGFAACEGLLSAEGRLLAFLGCIQAHYPDLITDEDLPQAAILGALMPEWRKLRDGSLS